jgi:hypothetical protein
MFSSLFSTCAVELTDSISSDKLAVLGFPCNQFGAQEPGTNAEIKAFAQGKGAKFPLFAKVCARPTVSHHARTSRDASRATFHTPRTVRGTDSPVLCPPPPSY